MKERFKTLIKDFQNRLPRNDVRTRELKVSVDSQKIISLIGPRHSGKTYYAFHLINQIQSEVGKDKIIYINFEDERLNLAPTHLQYVLEAYFDVMVYRDIIGGSLLAKALCMKFLITA